MSHPKVSRFQMFFLFFLFVQLGLHTAVCQLYTAGSTCSVESNLSCLLVCSQLLGFVYACYVVSAITEEEDSCELLDLAFIHTNAHSDS